MSIYQPYFYVIQEVSSGMYYAGAKWGKDADPNNFMVEGGYQTSSKTIKERISKNGLNSFIVCKIKIFETSNDAYEYETRFLQKIKAGKNPKFYNSHSNDHLFSFHDEKYKAKMIEVYGVEYPAKSKIIKEKISKANKGVKKPWLSEYNKSRIHPSLGKKMDKKFGQEISERNKRIWSNYNIEEKQNRKKAISNSIIDWNKNRSHEEKMAAIEKAAKSNRGKYWWNNGIIEVKSELSPGEDFIRGRLKK